mgnify:CR=1 FL=1|jgi:uncharacterized protein
MNTTTNIKNFGLAALLCVLALTGMQQAAAQERNPLGMSLYVIVTTRIPELAEEAAKYMPAHLAHQDELERQGIMFGAGSLRAEDAGTPGGPPVQGLIIIRADSFEHAREIADSDPMHAMGFRNYTLSLWRLNEGTFNVRVNFSDQSVEFN